MDLHALWYVLAALMVVVGLAGIVLPALPGLPLVFAGMMLAAWTDGFERVEWWWLLVLGVLTALSLLIDFWATAAGAKRVGASRKAVVGAVLGVALRAPLSRGRAPEIPATSLHCRRPDGTTKEVRVAQLCNIAPGSQVSVVGPTLMGRVSAWWVRVHDTNQLIVARGIIPSLIVMAVTGTALWAIYH